MKFATTSTFILLAFSLLQLVQSLPVPAASPDAPHKGAVVEVDDRDVNLDTVNNVIF